MFVKKKFDALSCFLKMFGISSICGFLHGLRLLTFFTIPPFLGNSVEKCFCDVTLLLRVLDAFRLEMLGSLLLPRLLIRIIFSFSDILPTATATSISIPLAELFFTEFTGFCFGLADAVTGFIEWSFLDFRCCCSRSSCRPLFCCSLLLLRLFARSTFISNFLTSPLHRSVFVNPLQILETSSSTSVDVSLLLLLFSSCLECFRGRPLHDIELRNISCVLGSN